MRYTNMREGVFLERPNRFIARVRIDGREEICHVKNTGRCRELLVPGATVWCQAVASPTRRTAFDLIAVQKGNRLINMDAQAPNRVFAEWVQTGESIFGAVDLQAEVRLGESRLDFLLRSPEGCCYVEVKGVTLEEAGKTRFPDAPTERGVKHLRELIQAVEQGRRGAVFFVIQLSDAVAFSPNDDTHPAFGAALRQAGEKGVEILAYDCRVTPEGIFLHRPVPVIL